MLFNLLEEIFFFAVEHYSLLYPPSISKNYPNSALDVIISQPVLTVSVKEHGKAGDNLSDFSRVSIFNIRQ
jgi:hypothetical protein